MVLSLYQMNRYDIVKRFSHSCNYNLIGGRGVFLNNRCMDNLFFKPHDHAKGG